ncbi:flavoprotein [Streptomyces sp. NPDC127098]|uniref:flavoprotein n=1 Tax=Streptomyces sp. NPDC127098 TaxID=3347137 RepID=UPI0036539BAE
MRGTDPGPHAAPPGDQPPVAALRPPPCGVSRLLYVGTGALSVAHTPFWLNWLRMNYPALDVRVVLTRSAERFVTPGALAPAAGREVLRDVWPEGQVTRAPHVEFTEWAQAVAVHPASMHFLARLAQGLADTPVLLALQCATVPVALAPSLPPGGLTSPAYHGHLAALAERPNIAVVPPTPGLSSTTGRLDASVAAPLTDLMATLEKLRVGSV